MADAYRSGFESLTLGFVLVAFAVSVLLAWLLEDWWLLIPIFLIAVGIYYSVTATTMRVAKDSSYTIFWGGTLALIGVLWLVNMQYPDNLVLLAVVFILWLGGFSMALALSRMRRSRRA